MQTHTDSCNYINISTYLNIVIFIIYALLMSYFRKTPFNLIFYTKMHTVVLLIDLYKTNKYLLVP